MSLLHLFKLPHNDAKRNHSPTLLWLHDNIIPVFDVEEMYFQFEVIAMMVQWMLL